MQHTHTHEAPESGTNFDRSHANNRKLSVNSGKSSAANTAVQRKREEMQLRGWCPQWKWNVWTPVFLSYSFLSLSTVAVYREWWKCSSFSFRCARSSVSNFWIHIRGQRRTHVCQCMFMLRYSTARCVATTVKVKVQSCIYYRCGCVHKSIITNA